MSPRLIVTIIRHLHAVAARIADHPLSKTLGDDGEKLTYFPIKTATFIHTPKEIKGMGTLIKI